MVSFPNTKYPFCPIPAGSRCQLGFPGLMAFTSGRGGPMGWAAGRLRLDTDMTHIAHTHSHSAGGGCRRYISLSLALHLQERYSRDFLPGSPVEQDPRAECKHAYNMLRGAQLSLHLPGFVISSACTLQLNMHSQEHSNSTSSTFIRLHSHLAGGMRRHNPAFMSPAAPLSCKWLPVQSVSSHTYIQQHPCKKRPRYKCLLPPLAIRRTFNHTVLCHIGVCDMLHRILDPVQGWRLKAKCICRSS